MALITLLAILIRKGDMPMETMLTRMAHSSLKYRRWNRTLLRVLQKCAITKTAEMAMAMSVAMAAPLMPSLRPKMKMGARTRLEKAPMSIVYMALPG